MRVTVVHSLLPFFSYLWTIIFSVDLSRDKYCIECTGKFSNGREKISVIETRLYIPDLTGSLTGVIGAGGGGGRLSKTIPEPRGR